MELISEQVVTSRISLEEEIAVRRAKIKHDEERLELDRAKLDYEKMKTEFEIKKHNDKHDLRKKHRNRRMKASSIFLLCLLLASHRWPTTKSQLEKRKQTR